MKFDFESISVRDADEIMGWRYPSPYHVYDVKGSVQLLNPAFHYHVSTLEQQVTAFLCYGEDAQVPGFDYDHSCVDIGWGLRPDLTGRGLGKCFLSQVMGFLRWRTEGGRHRATVAAFNERCQKACRSIGFECRERFVRPSDGNEFVVMIEREGEQGAALSGSAPLTQY